MPQAFRCGASVRPGRIAINETHEMATLGTAAHEALRSLAETGSIDWAEVPAIAERFDVSVVELRMLCGMAQKTWPSISASFVDALTEVAISAEVAEGVVLYGHLDLLSVTGNIARAGDWKTGRVDGDYSHQMKGYGALVLLENPDLIEVTVTVIWVRDGEIENYTMRRPELAAWLAALRDKVIDWDYVYGAGAHCAHCSRSHDCPAANALIRRDVAALTDQELTENAENALASMAPDEIVEILRKADMVAGYADRIRKAVKAHVIAHGDVTAGNVRLTIDTEQRRDIDSLAAWPVLEATGFGDEDFARCIDIRISKAEKIVAERAGRGKGAGAVRALGAALTEAGAVSVREIQKLSAKRA